MLPFKYMCILDSFRYPRVSQGCVIESVPTPCTHEGLPEVRAYIFSAWKSAGHSNLSSFFLSAAAIGKYSTFKWAGQPKLHPSWFWNKHT